jgi:hypothetical protein
LYNVAVATDHLHLLRLKKRLNLVISSMHSVWWFSRIPLQVGPNAKYNIADTEFVGQNVDSTFLAAVGGLDLLPEGTDVSEEEERDSEDEDQEEEDDEVEEEDEDLGFGLFDWWVIYEIQSPSSHGGSEEPKLARNRSWLNSCRGRASSLYLPWTTSFLNTSSVLRILFSSPQQSRLWTIFYPLWLFPSPAKAGKADRR